jgi:hypothetical protein
MQNKKTVLKRVKINYIRNFDEELLNVLKNIKSNNIKKIIFKYSKGLYNNASHFFHLLFNIDNNITFEKVLYLSKEKYETFDLFIKTKYFPIYLIGFNEDNFSIWEIEFYLENKCIKIIDFGRKIEIFEVNNDPEYPGYKILRNKIVKKTLLFDIMKFSYKNIINSKEKDIDVINEYKMIDIFERINNEISN